MKSFKMLKAEISEAHQEVSADFKVTASGRKVPVQRKNRKDELDDVEKDEVKESIVPDHMKGKQKPYVSSDGKGNYEVLGNQGQTKATFSRKEHGSEAQKKAQAHLRSKYDEYMKEDTELEENAPVAPVPDKKYIKGTPEWKANKEKNKPRTGHPTNEEVELEEGLSIHRVSVTVTDPHHPATTMRSKKHEKRVKVKARDREHAIDSALHFYKKQGLKVHDHNYIGQVNEDVEQVVEATDKEEQRLVQLARLGLVDKANVSKLRTAMEQLKADKPLSTVQRTMLLGVLEELVSLVTGDDQVFTRLKRDVQTESADKDKDDVPFDGPYSKKPSAVPGKNGSGYSTARHLARLALQKQQQKKKNK